MIAFVQPFGFYSPGGGSRILRALLEGEHPAALSICTEVLPAPPSKGIEELHVGLRPAVPGLERSRFHKHFKNAEGLFRAGFESRLRRVLEERGIRAIHHVPHGYDVVGVSDVARQMKIPLILNVHDDLEFTSIGHPLMKSMVAALGKAWREADQIFVISEEIGQEYSKRYGGREFEVITDGLTEVAEAPLARPQKSLRVYFMGMFHFRYRANMRALLDALKRIRKSHSDWDISVVCRCGTIFDEPAKDDVPVTVLPFAPESEVAKDMLSADLLYQPLPFEADAVNFGKFSLSTKLVTYLGSGLPILYHGPTETAAYNLLAGRRAAFLCATLEPERIAAEILESAGQRDAIVNHALALGRERFMLADQQRRFWGAIAKVM
jgi:hypothetical protein